MRPISRSPIFIASSACLLLALGLFHERQTCEPQGERVLHLHSQSQSLSLQEPSDAAVDGPPAVKKPEGGYAPRKTRSAILLHQAAQITHAPGERYQEMDLFTWVNKLGEEDLALLLEQTLSEDREIAEAWNWWGKGGEGDHLRGEVRSLILTRWARLNPENVLSTLMRLDKKTANLQQIGRMHESLFAVWIHTNAPEAAEAMLKSAAISDWVLYNRWTTDYVADQLVQTDIVVATDVFLHFFESQDPREREIGNSLRAKIIESVAGVYRGDGLLVWIDSLCEGSTDNTLKQTLLNDAIRALSPAPEFE